MKVNEKLKNEVFKSLKSALDNGYDDLFEFTDKEIAEDLKEYDSKMENKNEKELAIYIGMFRKELK